ncbi:MAG: T9SS type A sorting domain-containing protein [Bacteroidales bacterium]|nr:T9SS type A sorting domain-containing protein [Bacteroidales bacterium]
MKKLILFLTVLLIHTSGYSNTWHSFCPDSIHATNVCFGVGSSKGVICTPDGMYLHDDYNQVWNYYSNGGLPVWEAVHLNTTQILVVMGDGSWSDGIYTFDLQTLQFNVVLWCVKPNFIKHHELSGTYYVGYSGCLLKSTDGVIWEDVPYFNGKTCTCMDFYENHFVISETGNINNIYWSDDSGNTWNQTSPGVLVISDLKFNNMGVIYGIFPNYSNSSGLYSSDDYGLSWNLEFYADNMSAVGFDAINNIFVGWESPAGGYEGIAIYDPLSPPPGLTFLNTNLPCININKIKLNPTWSSIAIFCCTDNGVYFSNDYITSINQNKNNKYTISAFPNPLRNYTNINFTLPCNNNKDISINIFNNQGMMIDEICVKNDMSNEYNVRWEPDNLPAGIYNCIICSGQYKIYQKLLIY